MMEQAVVNAGMISMVAFPRVRSRGREGMTPGGVEDCLGIPDLGETSRCGPPPAVRVAHIAEEIFVTRPAESYLIKLGMRLPSEAWPMSARIAAARQPLDWSR